MVFGIDANLMDKGNKLLGVTVSKISSKVMKLSGFELFKDVFADEW